MNDARFKLREIDLHQREVGGQLNLPELGCLKIVEQDSEQSVESSEITPMTKTDHTTQRKALKSRKSA